MTTNPPTLTSGGPDDGGKFDCEGGSSIFHRLVDNLETEKYEAVLQDCRPDSFSLSVDPELRVREMTTRFAVVISKYSAFVLRATRPNLTQVKEICQPETYPRTIFVVTQGEFLWTQH